MFNHFELVSKPPNNYIGGRSSSNTCLVLMHLLGNCVSPFWLFGQIKSFFRSILVILVIFSGWSVSVAQAGDFPLAGDDQFPSKGVFKITPRGGVPMPPIVLNGPTCVARSGRHPRIDYPLYDPSGPLGDGSLCTVSPRLATSDADIGLFPFGFNKGLGQDEVHTEIVDMVLTGDGVSLKAGASASGACPPKRSLGEVEGRGGVGFFPADSFFNLFLEVNAFGITMSNPYPLTVKAMGIGGFPPIDATYMHTFDISGKVRLYNCENGCFVATLEQGSHGVDTDDYPRLARPRIVSPIVFSVDKNAEGLIIPKSCHPSPQDVYTLDNEGKKTEAELFQSSGAKLGKIPDMTNKNRLHSALSLRSALGLASGDNIISLSFGQDGGNILLFSVDPDAIGVAGTPVEFNSSLSPVGPALDPENLPSNGGGDPVTGGNEAAGDIYISHEFPSDFGSPPVVCTSTTMGVTAAPAGTNVLGVDESSLGLQAPAIRHSVNGSPEDDLDALEVGDASFVDKNRDDIIDDGRFVFFTLSADSPSLVDTAKANDILVATEPDDPEAPEFTIYARGVEDIGLQPDDVIDALALWDGGLSGVWGVGDEALFSLAAGSPSLSAGGNSPGDVFRTTFSNGFSLYATASDLGLLNGDELNALDIEPPPPPGCLVTLIDKSFTATASNGAVTIAWESASEIDNAGFFVWRGQLKAGKTACSKNAKDYKKVKKISPFILAKGSGASYSYSDSQVASGSTYCYALEDVDLSGKNTYHLDDITSASVQ